MFLRRPPFMRTLSARRSRRRSPLLKTSLARPCINQCFASHPSPRRAPWLLKHSTPRRGHYRRKQPPYLLLLSGVGSFSQDKGQVCPHNDGPCGIPSLRDVEEEDQGLGS